MQILTKNKTIKLKNEVITKMYNALLEMHDRKECEYHPDEDTIKCPNHEEIMDIVLKHFYANPTEERKYDWANTGDLSNLIKKD